MLGWVAVSRPISMEQLAAMCEDQVDGFWAKLLFGIRSGFFDAWYYPVEEDEMDNLLYAWRTNVLPRLHYVVDKWDCDDFSEYFASLIKLWSKTNCCGMAIGVVETSKGEFGHAWNICLVQHGNTYNLAWIEPQLGIFIPPSRTITITEKPITVRGRHSVVRETIRYRLLAVIW